MQKMQFLSLEMQVVVQFLKYSPHTQNSPPSYHILRIKVNSNAIPFLVVCIIVKLCELK